MSIKFHLIASHLVEFKELQMSSSSCPLAIAIAIVNKKNLYLYRESFYQDRSVSENPPKKTHFFSKKIFLLKINT
jgi:hypothetical protein